MGFIYKTITSSVELCTQPALNSMFHLNELAASRTSLLSSNNDMQIAAAEQRPTRSAGGIHRISCRNYESQNRPSRADAIVHLIKGQIDGIEIRALSNSLQMRTQLLDNRSIDFCDNK